MKTPSRPNSKRFYTTIAVSCAAASTTLASITGVPGGDIAPPPTLGPYTMTLFGSGPSAVFDPVSSIPSPLGGSLGISPDVIHLDVPTTWGSWSHGYTGEVYWTDGGLSLTLTLPANTGAFFLYAQPNESQVFDIQAAAQDGTMVLQSPDGNAGATYYGFYATGGDTIQTITISSAVDFAIGEFGIADLSAIPEPGTWGSLGTVIVLTGWRWLRGRGRKM